VSDFALVGLTCSVRCITCWIYSMLGMQHVALITCWANWRSKVHAQLTTCTCTQVKNQAR
jgi:hypothetical protein